MFKTIIGNTSFIHGGFSIVILTFWGGGPRTLELPVMKLTEKWHLPRNWDKWDVRSLKQGHPV